MNVVRKKLIIKLLLLIPVIGLGQKSLKTEKAFEEFLQDYQPLCKGLISEVKQGQFDSICDSAIEILFQQSQKNQSTPKQEADKKVRFCRVKTTYLSNEKEDCEEKKAEHLNFYVYRAIQLGLCQHDEVSLIADDMKLSKKGRDVYTENSLAVNCQLNQFDDFGYYEGFFPDTTVIDYDAYYETEKYLQEYEYLQGLSQALEKNDQRVVFKLIENHVYGKSVDLDRQFLEPFLTNDDRLLYLQSYLKHSKNKVNFEVEYYNQPLYEAIDNDAPILALELLQAGADPFIPGKHGLNLMVKAAGKGYIKLVEQLLIKGWDVNGTLRFRV